jgi:hypothetical protein
LQMTKRDQHMTQHVPVVTEWTTIFTGLDIATGFASHAFGIDLPPLRIQRASMARIDLQAKGISFLTTPASGSLQTIGQTVTDFLIHNPSVRLAINANFSWVANGFQAGVPYSLFGLAVSSGKVVCDPTQPAPRPPPPTSQPDVPDDQYAGAVALLITTGNYATFQVATAANPPDLSGVWVAVAGSTPPVSGGFPPMARTDGPLWLVQDGINQVDPNSAANMMVAARTAVGLSDDGRYLFFVVAEGRENSSPAYGAALYDIAEWLLIAGANTGINLDGGGSSVMAMTDQGEPILLSIPYGDEATPGVQRPVGNFLGVIADL